MPITVEMNGKPFGEWLNAKIEGKERQIIAILEKVGLDCLSEARQNGKYKDRTGNLRSSTGFAVIYRGQVVQQSSFKSISVSKGTMQQPVKSKTGKISIANVKIGGNGTIGSQTGKELLENLCSAESGTALIFVAGMNYAKYVEARQYNVLESAYALAKRQIKSNLNMIFKD